MKAERGEGKFIPIVITLETEEEAKLLWELLGCSTNALGKLAGYEIPSQLDDKVNIPRKVDAEMFDTLDSVYMPEKKDC